MISRSAIQQRTPARSSVSTARWASSASADAKLMKANLGVGTSGEGAVPIVPRPSVTLPPRRSRTTGEVTVHHLRQSLFVAAVIGCAASQVGVAFQAPAPAVKVCSLLTQAEVRKLIGGSSAIDHLFKPEEEAVAGGSSCNYPDVMIQVIPFRQSPIDTMRKRGGLEAVSGVGRTHTGRQSR